MDQQNRISLLIKIPEDRVNEITRLLNRAGIEVDPRSDMIAFEHDAGALTRQFVLTNDGIEELKAETNNFLKNSGINYRLPRNGQKWTPAGEREFLRMAAREFQWNRRGAIEGCPRLANGESWTEIAKDYPQMPQRTPRN